LWGWFSRNQSSISIDRATDHPEFARYLERRHLKDALVAPLQGETRLVGLLVLGNRLSDVTKFNEGDLRLVETLGSHISMALENGRLEQALEQLQTLKNQLTYEAFHDPLTNLANRVLFGERVGEALAREYQATSLRP